MGVELEEMVARVRVVALCCRVASDVAEFILVAELARRSNDRKTPHHHYQIFAIRHHQYILHLFMNYIETKCQGLRNELLRHNQQARNLYHCLFYRPWIRCSPCGLQIPGLPPSKAF
jgi:hypothetical protein